MHVEFSATEPSARFSFVVCFLFVLLLVRLKKYLYGRAVASMRQDEAVASSSFWPFFVSKKLQLTEKA